MEKTQQPISNEEMNKLIIESSVEQFWPVIVGEQKVPVEQKIADAETYCKSIAIAGIEDKANYKLAKDAHRRIKSWRTGLEAKRKELKAVALEYGRKVDGEAKRLTALIEPIEAELATKIQAIDKAAEEAARQEQLRRHRLLTDNGWEQAGAWYICGPLNLTMETIAAATEEQLQAWVEHGAQAKAAKEQEARLKAEEAERVRLENERLAAEAEALRKKLAALEAQQKPQEPTVTVEHTTGPAYEVHETRKPFEQPTAPAVATPANTDTPLTPPRVGTVTAFDYEKGFEDCRAQVLAIFNDPTPRKRADFIELISNLKPSK